MDGALQPSEVLGRLWPDDPHTDGSTLGAGSTPSGEGTVEATPDGAQADHEGCRPRTAGVADGEDGPQED